MDGEVVAVVERGGFCGEDCFFGMDEMDRGL